MRHTSATSTARGPGVSHINLDTSSLKFLFVKTVNGRLSLLLRTEGHEAEALVPLLCRVLSGRELSSGGGRLTCLAVGVGVGGRNLDLDDIACKGR